MKSKNIISFLKKIYNINNKENAVIAVSGGIDSAVSLTLLSQAIDKKNIFPVLLPYRNQDMSYAKKIIDFLKIPEENVSIIEITKIVQSASEILELNKVSDQFRLGNIMARARMIVVYDRAKELDALVCGTENKSEKYLGYFTRFGDEASDIEPIQHLYKTEIRNIAKELQVPKSIIDKAPSAGLWTDQADEVELGFSYSDADQILKLYVDQQKSEKEILDLVNSGHLDINLEIVKKVISRVESVKFKHLVPYHL